MLIEYKIILIILSVWIYNEDKRNKKKKKTQTIINNDNNNAIDKNADEKADEKRRKDWRRSKWEYVCFWRSEELRGDSEILGHLDPRELYEKFQILQFESDF